MSIEKYIFVVCDICIKESDAPGRSVLDARMFAESGGWYFSNGIDICPECHQQTRQDALQDKRFLKFQKTKAALNSHKKTSPAN